MQSDLKPCPLCGALPCDWVDDPHKMEVGLCWTLAKIREVLGVNEKPMMDELPGIIKDRIEAQAAEIARLREANGILEDGLQEVGDDYPGSSCQEWCQHQIKMARAALEARP